LQKNYRTATAKFGLLFRDVQKKADTMIKKIEKQGQLNRQIHKALKCAQSIEELNHLVRFSQLSLQLAF